MVVSVEENAVSYVHSSSTSITGEATRGRQIWKRLVPVVHDGQRTATTRGNVDI